MRAPRLGAVLAAAALLVLFTAGPALAEQVRLTASGSGAEEVPAGEADATVRADMTVDTESGSITYTVRVSGNDEPAAAAHIHRAPRGQAGDVVVPLDPAAVNEGRQATAAADPAVVREIAENPENFYVNVHSPRFQQGFARSQLQAASSGSVPSGDGSSASDVPALVGAGLVLAGVGAVALGMARRRRGGAAA